MAKCPFDFILDEDVFYQTRKRAGTDGTIIEYIKYNREQYEYADLHKWKEEQPKEFTDSISQTPITDSNDILRLRVPVAGAMKLILYSKKSLRKWIKTKRELADNQDDSHYFLNHISIKEMQTCQELPMCIIVNAEWNPKTLKPLNDMLSLIAVNGNHGDLETCLATMDHYNLGYDQLQMYNLFQRAQSCDLIREDVLMKLFVWCPSQLTIAHLVLSGPSQNRRTRVFGMLQHRVSHAFKQLVMTSYFKNYDLHTTRQKLESLYNCCQFWSSVESMPVIVKDVLDSADCFEVAGYLDIVETKVKELMVSQNPVNHSYLVFLERCAKWCNLKQFYAAPTTTPSGASAKTFEICLIPKHYFEQFQQKFQMCTECTSDPEIASGIQSCFQLLESFQNFYQKLLLSILERERGYDYADKSKITNINSNANANQKSQIARWQGALLHTGDFSFFKARIIELLKRSTKADAIQYLNLAYSNYGYSYERVCDLFFSVFQGWFGDPCVVQFLATFSKSARFESYQNFIEKCVAYIDKQKGRQISQLLMAMIPGKVERVMVVHGSKVFSTSLKRSIYKCLDVDGK